MTGNAVADTLTGPGMPAPVAGAPEEERRRRRRKYLLLFLLGLGLFLLTIIAIWYFLFRKPIRPLPDLPNAFRPPAYSASIYGANTAIGVATSRDGSRIYVAETEGDRALRVFDAGGRPVNAARPPAETTGPEHVPVWVAIDPKTSEVYVTDRPTGEIYIFDRDGGFLRTFTPLEQIRGWQPVGIAFDQDGNLYVTDMGGKVARVEVFDRAGNLVRTLGENDGLAFPNGLAVDERRNVYVADSNNGRLLMYGPDGTLIGRVGRGVGVGKLGLPRGVAVDDDGRVYVGDPTAQGVHVFRGPNGNTGQLENLGFFGAAGIRDGYFQFPNGVATDARGWVYVADTFNDRVQIWSY
jgi:DNA-binding beta-propeller fold protein YncE